MKSQANNEIAFADSDGRTYVSLPPRLIQQNLGEPIDARVPSAQPVLNGTSTPPTP